MPRRLTPIDHVTLTALGEHYSLRSSSAASLIHSPIRTQLKIRSTCKRLVFEHIHGRCEVCVCVCVHDGECDLFRTLPGLHCIKNIC